MGFSVGVIAMAIYSMYEFFIYNVAVPKEQAEKNLKAIYETSKPKDEFSMTFQEFHDTMYLPRWVWSVNIVGQCSGVLVVIIAFLQLWNHLIIPAKELAQEDPV